MEPLTQPELVALFGEKALEKTHFSFLKLLLLSIQGGAFIGLGYVLYLRVVGTLPQEWGSFGNLLGGLVFPIGLMGILFVGGELATGNMMVMQLGVLQKKIRVSQMLYNWVIVTIGNLLGCMLVAYLLGHIVGLAEGDFLAKTISLSEVRVYAHPVAAFFSAIGCNIFVCMAVWVATSTRDVGGKILGLWLPVMAFVAIGFQHVVANGFILPAAIFSGQASITWLDYLENTGIVFLGNAVGGALLMAFPLYFTYGKNNTANKKDEDESIH